MSGNGEESFRAPLIPKIPELHIHWKIMAAHGGDDRLQIIAALARHANFVALDLRRHLEFAVADEGGDLLGHAGFNAVLELDDLTRMAERRDIRITLLDAFHRDATLGEFANDNFIQRADLEIVVGGQFDLRLFQGDLPFASLEIEAIGEFFLGLIDGVFKFHRVDLRNNIE